MPPEIEGPISANVRRYMDGVTFPVSKNNVLHAFRVNGAPNSVVARLSEVPQTHFASAEDLEAAYRERLTIE